MSMKKKIFWENIAHSFKEAEEFDTKYYSSLSPEERLSDIQFCREQYFKITRLASAKRGRLDESRKRLRRTVKVIQRKQS